MVRGVASGALFYALLAKGQPHACVRGPSGDIVNLAESGLPTRALHDCRAACLAMSASRCFWVQLVVWPFRLLATIVSRCFWAQFAGRYERAQY
jgi:hypothetical protein